MYVNVLNTTILHVRLHGGDTDISYLRLEKYDYHNFKNQYP